VFTRVRICKLRESQLTLFTHARKEERIEGKTSNRTSVVINVAESKIK
jgi:hypothetical protein